MNKVLPTCAAAALFCAGCLHTVDTVENAEKTYVPDEVIRLHVETDATQPVKVTNILQATAANGFMMLAVEVTNTSTSDQIAFYRLDWFDETGMTVTTSLTQWNEVRLLGRGAKQLKFTAPNAVAKDFKIHLFEAPR